MSRIGLTRGLGLLALGLGLCLTPLGAQSPRPANPAPASPASAPKLEAVAETRLLMEGLAQANYRGLERLLKQQPADADTWVFARGQALLLAETGNLLLIRPPRNQGERAWMKYAQELRDGGVGLARHLQNKDYSRSQVGLLVVADVCNRCHQTFKVPTRIGPVGEPVPLNPPSGTRDTE